MNQPRTSIIIPSYRGETKLPTLLNALSQQSDTGSMTAVQLSSPSPARCPYGPWYWSKTKAG